MESEERTKEAMLLTFSRSQALQEGHFVFASGRHGKEYINKDAIYPHVRRVSYLCFMLAEKLRDTQASVVVAPEKGGILLSRGIARQLIQLTGKDILSVYAERDEDILYKSEDGRSVFVAIHDMSGGRGEFYAGRIPLLQGDSILIKRSTFSLRRGYDKIVAGKKVLVVEDIINTGESVRKTVEAVRRCGGEVVGVGALCNRGSITAKDLCEVPRFEVLADVPLESWNEEDCPLCKEGIEVNVDLGKGKEFLARKYAERAV